MNKDQRAIRSSTVGHVRGSAPIRERNAQMDSANLFSHPNVPETTQSKETSEKPAEYPTFSDRPDKETSGAAKPSP
jgi:hypothetical protein